MKDASPLVASVAARLVERIRTGDLAVAQPLPAERQLAEELGVSRIVVRSAVRRLEADGFLLCKPRCRPVVQMPTGAPAPRVATASGNRYVALWLWPSAAEYVSATILSGIQRVALPGGPQLVISGADGGDWESILDSEARFLRSVAEDPLAAGAIVWYLGCSRNLPALEAVRHAGVPLVFVDRLPPEGFEADFVGTNNERAAAEAMRHLIGLRHRRIAVVSNVDRVSSVREREAGYRRALSEAGLELPDELVQRVRKDEESGVAAALDALLGLEEPPTAICGINDNIALQIHDALVSRGIDVPGEISVVGFDGLLGWLPGGGYLTTAHQDFLGVGQTAAELIRRRLENGGPLAYRHVLLDAPLREHGSTARARTASSPAQDLART